MKVAVAFALVAACVAATYSAPATQSVDWTAVKNKFAEIKLAVRSVSVDIRSLANSESEELGIVISEKLDVVLAEALVVLEEAEQAAQAQSLTEDKAKQLITKLVDILNKIPTDIMDQLFQFSTEGLNKFFSMFFPFFTFIEGKADQIYAFLRAAAVLSTFSSTEGSILLEIENAFRTAIYQTKDIANQDNEQVGAIIAAKLDVALGQALAIIEETREAVADQTSWTDEKAHDFVIRILNSASGIMTNMPELGQLSSGARDQIWNEYTSLSTFVTQKSLEFYAHPRL